MLENPDYTQETQDLPDAEAVAAFAAAERARLREAFHAAPSGREHGRALTALFDAVVRRLFAMATAEAEASVQPTGVEIAVLATGGYGRRELCPRSDIDISFVAAEEEDPYLDAVVRRMFFLIMDVFTVRSDLKVGYAFRVPEECADVDHQTLTALLDGRRIAGSEALVQRFEEELLRTLRPAAFLYGKVAEREEVRRKFGDSVYRAEPDLKEGAGGLRDLHFVEWAARAQAGVPLGDPWEHLLATGDVDAEERARAEDAREFLLRLRHALHYVCDRRFDCLTRVRQDEVAAALGYADGRVLMDDYFRHAEVAHGTAEVVVERVRRRALPLADGLVVQDGQIRSGADTVWTDLAGVLEVFRHGQTLGLPLHSSLGRRIAGYVGAAPAPANEGATSGGAPQKGRTAPDPSETGTAALPAGRAFLDILRENTALTEVLRQMARWGVLQHLIPEFGESLRLVPVAPVHEYTVGEHALRAVALLEDARDGRWRENSDHARIFGEVKRPEVLFVAALLHDIGKRAASAHHAVAGAVEAHAVALRLGLDAEAADAVAFLVRHHLLMSDTARLRDLTQQQTIRDFAAVVNDVDRLNELFLLTCADMRATGGGVWTPVQERFLEDLYFRALRALAAPEAEEDMVARVQRQRRRMERELTLKNLPAAAVQEHCNAMPPGYLLNTPLDTIARHIRLVERLGTEGPVVEFVDPPDRDYTTVTLCTFDDPQPGLLSKIAAAFYAHSINVHAAQVLTRDGEPGIALDTLWAASDGRRLRPYDRAELDKDLRDVLAGRITAEALLRRQGKIPQPDLSRADVRVHNDVSEMHTVIEVRTSDCKGLLYGLTHRLSELGWDIHSARINTIAGEARDAFYVTRAGAKLSEDAAAVRERLLAQG